MNWHNYQYSIYKKKLLQSVVFVSRWLYCTNVRKNWATQPHIVQWADKCKPDADFSSLYCSRSRRFTRHPVCSIYNLPQHCSIQRTMLHWQLVKQSVCLAPQPTFIMLFKSILLHTFAVFSSGGKYNVKVSFVCLLFCVSLVCARIISLWIYNN